MCTTCGCSGNSYSLSNISGVKKPADALSLSILNTETANLEPVTYATPEPAKTVVDMERDILDKNNRLAERNRGYFEAKNILALNIVSSPGSGKTALLERTLAEWGKNNACFVIEGDQQTARDAERIAASGTPVVQVNTGKGCHLEAKMVNDALHRLQPVEGSTVFIENVGNLVCPSMFDLGECKRIVVISVTEGEDKPVKYPDMFRTADLCLINKIDLLPHLDCNVNALRQFALEVNPRLEFLDVSARTGEGMEAWYAWLDQELAECYNIGPVI